MDKWYLRVFTEFFLLPDACLLFYKNRTLLFFNYLSFLIFLISFFFHLYRGFTIRYYYISNILRTFSLFFESKTLFVNHSQNWADWRLLWIRERLCSNTIKLGLIWSLKILRFNSKGKFSVLGWGKVASRRLIHL